MKKTFLSYLVFLAAFLPVIVGQEASEVPDFYKTDKIQDIRLTFNTDNWRYVLDSLRFNDAGFLEATVEVNGQEFKGAGVQYRKTKSFWPGSKRNPFIIRLDYSGSRQNLHGYTIIKLSNALRDPGMVREVLSYEIARQYMPAPRANYARLTVNGEYYGLMVNIEPVEDAAFRKRFFDSSKNAFFKANELLKNEEVGGCKKNIYGSLQYDKLPKCYLNNFEKYSEHGVKELMELARVLNETPDKISNHLDVDATLWMHAFNDVLVNLYSYAGHRSINYFLYKNNKGKFVPIVGDLNLAFGSYKNIGRGSDIKTRQLYALDPLLHANNPAKPLISQLLANPLYKKIYLSHLRTILYDYFVNNKYIERARELQDMIRTDFINDPNKFYDLADFNNSLTKVIGRRSKIPGLQWLMEKRTSFLKKHPKVAVFPSEITDVQVARRQPMSVKQVDNFKISVQVGQFPKRVTLLYRLGDQHDYRTLNMSAKGNGKYEATVTPPNGERTIDFYIVAENAGMVSYSPPDYNWRQHHASLDELNK